MVTKKVSSSSPAPKLESIDEDAHSSTTMASTNNNSSSGNNNNLDESNDEAVSSTVASRNSNQNNNIYKNENSGNSPIYVYRTNSSSQQEQQTWELTWPIWHMLPRSERRDIARREGFKSIGEFEEYVTLQRAVHEGGDANETQHQDEPYSSEALYQAEANPQNWGRPTVAQKVVPSMEGKKLDDADSSEEEDDDGDDDEREENLDPDDDRPGATLNNKKDSTSQEEGDESNVLSTKKEEDPIKRGGLIMLLPDEILFRIFSHLDISIYSAAALVCHAWQPFTRTETVYKALCERCYLQQSKRKTLNVSRFGNSFRNMLRDRPRVRTGGGLYVLKYTSVKKIQRDMWTEIPVGAVLETVYYRYMYFRETGKVLYALTTTPPHEMILRMHRTILAATPNNNNNNNNNNSESSPLPSGMVWGRYQVKKFMVSVWASHAWHDVKMELKLLPNGIDSGGFSSGIRFGALSFERHWSSASGNFDEYFSPDLVEYKVPDESFQFLKDRRL